MNTVDHSSGITEGKIPLRPLPELLSSSVAAWADRPCVDFLGAKWTYGQIGDLVDRAAEGFRRLGVAKGSRVGLCLPNTPYYVVCYFAVLKAGGIVVNFNPLYVDRELEFQTKDSGAEIMVTMDLAVMFPKVDRLRQTAGVKTVVVCPMATILPFPTSLLFRLFKRSDVSRVPRDAAHPTFADLISGGPMTTAVPIDAVEDVAVIQYTGGTTGVPKGAMLTHANISANAEQVKLWVPDGFLKGDQRMLGVLPLFHVFAMTAVMNFGLRIGSELILLPRFELAQVMDVIEKKRPTIFPGVPTIYTAINREAERSRRNLSSIQCCISGGAGLPEEVRVRFEALTGCRLIEGYGLSEASPVVTCNPVVGLQKNGSIGMSLPETTVEIRTPVTSEKELGLGEKGEICVRGPQVMKGYWGRPDATAEQFHDGALRTGDIGYRDEDGFIFLVDRLKDIIICGGYNVYPRVLEEALYQHPAVEEATVIGVPDTYRGQAPMAFVKLKADREATPDELMSHLKGWVSKIELPKAIEIREALPKTLVGKLSKKELIAEMITRDTLDKVDLSDRP